MNAPRLRNRVFFPQGALDVWLADDRVELTAEELVLRPTGRRYRIVEAVRVLREVTGGTDTNELVGHVKSKAFLTELGAEILEGSMIIGDNAYDVVQGFAASPAGPFAQFAGSAGAAAAGCATDEDLLLRFADG